MKITYDKEKNAFVIDANDTTLINDGESAFFEQRSLTNPHGVELHWSGGKGHQYKETYLSMELRKMPFRTLLRAMFIRLFYKRRQLFKVPDKVGKIGIHYMND